MLPDYRTASGKQKLTLALILFASYFKIGLFTFGGGYAMIALIEREFVSRKKWITTPELYEIIAISESPAGYLLLSTSAGFVRYDPDDNESEGYDRIAGFPIANLSRNGIHSAGNGEIFVAGYKNLISFSEARLKQHSAPDMIYFTSLLMYCTIRLLIVRH